MRGEGPLVAQVVEVAEEHELTRRVGAGQPRQEEPPEQAGQHAHRQQETGFAAHPVRIIERYSSARHDHVHMRMVAPTPTIP
jgi:CO/xanthine dehydrogenase Mo-binding subunit